MTTSTDQSPSGGPTDSPVDWVQDHIRRYVATDGEDGYLWRGYPTLLLTTTGRTSGQQRRTALIFSLDGEVPLIVASQGGAPEHPSWYRNIEADPTVTVQIKGDVFRARAVTVSLQDKARVWPIVVDVYPPYAEYQAKTERDIPVVRLERLEG